MGTVSATGVVAAATPEAADAGVRILEAGGNAVDAAIAVSLALGVTEPAGSGIGGQATFIVHRTGAQPFVLNGTSYAPRATPTNATLVDLVGHRASTVPSALRVLDFAWREHGSGHVGWQQLLEPAIGYAQDGWTLSGFRHKSLLRWAQSIRKSGVATRLLLDERGHVPPPGSIVRQPLVASTLERIAREGAADFYEGQIADAIVRDMEENEGWITREDLAHVREPLEVAPLHGSYRGWDVYTLPPPAGGWVVLLALNILELFPQGELVVDGPDRLVRLADALTAAHDRRVQRPPADLANYDASLQPRISKDQAKKVLRTLPPWSSGETTHFSVVDANGTAVGVTQSLNGYYGAKVAHPQLGFLYNDYMREYVLGVRQHPFALRPGAPPYSSMSASTVARSGELHLVLGSPGDERIISAVIQVIHHWIDVRRGIGDAVAAPRVHTIRGGGVLLETAPEDPTNILALERRGYQAHRPLSSLFAGDLNPYFGGVHAVARDDDEWKGAADPRRDGAVRYARRSGPPE